MAVSKTYHSNLASYFDSKPLYLDEPIQKKLNVRKLDELPWQQVKTGDFKGLEKTLVDVEIFLAYSNRDRFEIWKYWQDMPNEYKDFVSIYLNAIDNWRDKLGKTNRFELALNELSHFFFVNDKKDESAKLFEDVIQLAKTLYHEGDIRLAIRQNNLAACYVHKQDWQKALELFECARPVYINERGLDDSDTWILLEGIAVCKIHMKNVEEGIQGLIKCFEYNKRRNGESSYATANCMYNLADAYTFNHEYPKSISLFQECLKIYKNILEIDHPLTIDCIERLNDWLRLSSLKDQATDFERNDNFYDALKVYIQLEDLCAELASKPAMANCLFGKARSLRAIGQETEAISEAKMALNFAEDSNLKLIEPIQIFLKAKQNGNNSDFFKIPKSNTDYLKELYLKTLPDLREASSNEFLRRLALSRFKMGDYQTAEELLNRLLDTGFEIVSTHIHLARLFLITDQITKCREHIDQGWIMKSEAKPYVLSRLLWFKVALAFINGEPFKIFLGQIKTVLQNEDAVMEWTMEPILDHLKLNLSEKDLTILSALVDAMSFSSKICKLEIFDIWKYSDPQPIK